MTIPGGMASMLLVAGLVALSAIACTSQVAPPTATIHPSGERSQLGAHIDGRHTIVDKIHPDLYVRADALSTTDRVSVTVSFVESGDILAELDQLTFPDNIEVSTEAELTLRAARQTQNLSLVNAFSVTYGAQLIDYCLLIRCMDFSVSAGQVRSIADRPDVLYIDPFESDEVPSGSTCPSENCAPAKTVAAFLNTPQLRSLRLIDTRTALLDTGVYTQHVLLKHNPSIRYVGRLKCAGTTCESPCTDATCDKARTYKLEPAGDLCRDHGSMSASIMIGNNQRGSAHDGLTDFTLDSLQIYNHVYKEPPCKLNNHLARLSIEYAFFRLGSRVIIVEAQDRGSSNSSLARTADSAFRHGVVVIAPNGNSDNNNNEESRARGPGNARNVLSVGIENLIENAEAPGSYSRRTGSGYRAGRVQRRIKPDVLGITEACGAISSSGFEQCVAAYGGTSGAAVSVAGAASLLRAWLARDGTAEPGFTYAHLILSGRFGGRLSDVVGAGGLCLPAIRPSAYWRDTVTLAGGEQKEVGPLMLDQTIGTGQEAALDVAAWWPDTSENHMSMRLTSPTGCTWVSEDEGSVFLKIKVSNIGTLNPIARGSWKLTISNKSSSPEQATVYWAAAAHSVPLNCRAKNQPNGFEATPPEPYGSNCS